MLCAEISPLPPRIPIALQEIFLASNRGEEILVPPSGNVAVKVFDRTTPKVEDHLCGSSSQGPSELPAPTSECTEHVQVSTAALDAKPKPSKASRAIRLVNYVSRSFKKRSQRKKTTQKESPRKFAKPKQNCSPQDHLDIVARSRGYSTTRYKTLTTAYYNKPTALQKASYQEHILQLAKTGNKIAFSRLFEAGISLNPCNCFGESILHMICRRGHAALLHIMIENGSELRVSNDIGRTPLHEACWASPPNFQLIEMLVEQDRSMLFMADQNGNLPLSHVRRDYWRHWAEWIDSCKERIWPLRDVTQLGEEGPPPLTLLSPNSRPIRDPMNALSPNLACMVASGTIGSDAARFLNFYERGYSECTSVESYSDSDESDDESIDEDLQSVVSKDVEDEMNAILRSFGARSGETVSWSA